MRLGRPLLTLAILGLSACGKDEPAHRKASVQTPPVSPPSTGSTNDFVMPLGLPPTPPILTLKNLQRSHAYAGALDPKQVRAFIYSRDLTYRYYWIDTPELVGFGLYLENPTDRILGEKIMELYEDQGPTVLENFKTAYLRMCKTWNWWTFSSLGPRHTYLYLHYVYETLVNESLTRATTVGKLSYNEVIEAIDETSPDVLRFPVHLMAP